MSDKENKSPITIKEEEIDLVKLFSLIRNAFSKLFSNIVSLFKGVLHYLILVLIFLKTHLVKILSATLTGAILGFFVDFLSPKQYTYDMIIQPNFHAVDQLYENQEYYNVLIEEEDSITLAKKFGISYDTANNLESFELIPYETQIDVLLAYDNFIKKTDTLTQKHFSFQTFKGTGASKFDSQKYVYRINSHQETLKSFQDEIIEDVNSNFTLQKRMRVKLNTLKLDSIATINAIADAKDLRSLYKEVILLEVENNKSSASTYIDFSKETKDNNDIQLFNIVKELNNNLIAIEIQKETSENIINIITTFNPSGKKLKTFYQTKVFRLGGVFGGLVILFILFKLLGTYLKEYQSKISL